MCFSNANEDEMKTYYCHTEGRIVPKTQVIEVCDPLGHQVEFSKDDEATHRHTEEEIL